MACDSQSVSGIEDHILTSFNNFILIFHTNSAVDLLYTNREGELRGLLLGNLTSQKGNIMVDVEELCIFMFPAAYLASLNIALDDG
jgi:hypothetical protein